METAQFVCPLLNYISTAADRRLQDIRTKITFLYSPDIPLSNGIITYDIQPKEMWDIGAWNVVSGMDFKTLPTKHFFLALAQAFW